MKVLLVFSASREPDHWICRMTQAGLTAAGQEVFAFEPYYAMEALGAAGSQRLLIQMVQALGIDWVLAFPPFDLIAQQTAAALGDLGVPITGLRFDDPVFMARHRHRPRRAEELLLLGYDTCHWIATTSVEAHERLHAMGASRMRWSPLPISTATYPFGNVTKRFPVSFIGRPQGGFGSPRVTTVLRLLAAGIDVRVWGEGWAEIPEVPAAIVGPPLSFAGMVETIHQSLLCLTPPDYYHGVPNQMLKLRNLEVASCGGVQVQGQCRDVDAHFVPGVEYLPFDDLDGLVAQVRNALAAPAELQAIGARAAARVRRDCDMGDWTRRVVADLQAEGWLSGDRQPDRAAAEPYALASLFLAHLHERRGAMARAYSHFHDVGRLFPADQTARAGLARLQPYAGPGSA